MMFLKSALSAGYLLVSLSAVLRANGFQPLSSPYPNRRQETSLCLTSEEILARARKASGLPDEPKIFEDSVLNDMQSALLKLERRVKDGPGSLSILDTEELDLEFGRIITEMHSNAHKRVPKPSPIIDVTPASSNTVTQAPATQAGPAATVAKNAKPITDISLDEGPMYDGLGGMGQPRGTLSTYVIEGMDEMSPAEYQKALQDSIIERQRIRRATITTGNKSTWDYLSSLGAGAGPQGSKSDKDAYKPFPGKS